MTPLPGREEPDRPLEGLGRFAWKIALASVLAIAGVAIVLMLRGADRPDAPGAGVVAAPASPPARDTDTLRDVPAQRAESATGRDVDRRHAAGQLSEAQRKFEPCRGGDVRRVAWIDAQQRVRKLAQLRATGLVLEQWFDEEGRVREAVVRTTAAGSEWTRRVTLDEAGRATVVDTPAGIAPDEPPPGLLRGDPSGAFFSGPGCGG